MTAYIIPGILAPEEIIAQQWGTTIAEMQSRTRKRHVVEARQVAMWYMMTRQNYSEAQAGHVFGRDHATAHHAKMTVYNLMESDKTFRNNVQQAIRRLDLFTKMVREKEAENNS